MESPQIADLPSAEQSEKRPFVIWTDDYNNLLQVLH